MSNATLNAVRQLFKALVQHGKFDRVLNKVEIVGLEKGKLIAEMTVTDEHANLRGTLHGGMTATIIDEISTFAFNSYQIQMTNEPPKFGSASVEMSISFMGPVRVGDTILIEAWTEKVGKNLAFLSVNIFNKNKDNQLVATGKHTKFILSKSQL